MRVTIFGPLPANRNFFDFAFDVGFGDADFIEPLSSTPTALVIENTYTNTVTTFSGRNLDLNFDVEPPRLSGTIKGWETRDASGNVVATVSDLNWSGAATFAAFVDLWDYGNPNDIAALFSNQDITIDATGAVGPLGETDFDIVSSNITYLGGRADERVFTGSGNDVLRGAAGNDVLEGRGGNDRLFGDAGRDVLRGGNGNDNLNGGGGNDRLFGDGGRDVLRGGNGNDNLNGGGGNDRLFGDAGRDVLRGGGGNDNLNGGGGNDRLFGDAGRDVLRGDNGNDLLNGGGGRDRIIGGNGDDTAIGGRAADTFVFSDGDDSLTIRDFRFRDNDRLELDDDLWSGDMTAAQVVSIYGDVVDGDLVLDFGNGDMIVLEGMTNANRLSNFIDIV